MRRSSPRSTASPRRGANAAFAATSRRDAIGQLHTGIFEDRLFPDCATWLPARLVGPANALALAMLGENLPPRRGPKRAHLRCVDDYAFWPPRSPHAPTVSRRATRALAATARRSTRRKSSLLSPTRYGTMLRAARIAARTPSASRRGFLAKRAPVFPTDEASDPVRRPLQRRRRRRARSPTQYAADARRAGSA